MNDKVDAFIARAKQWGEEFAALRAIALDAGLTEELKWGTPCYTLGGANIVLIHGFKEYCAYLLFKGALLKDPKGILVQQTAKVQAARQIRFRSAADIKKLTPTLKAYLKEAVQVEQAGLKVPMKETAAFAVPEEFQQKLVDEPGLKTAFDALTPGRQRAYLLHFGDAKQAKTRSARIEKFVPKILAGKGMDD
ncbi:YdeI family protein [Massilia sp. TS11]|uniref:YdeI/OmpD-associated family protein n=1 Tax=Massilia sp. TS11 TaxID=2908003 RepID=UPI001EDC0E48|nr:YdeI/OmpD-associated family protein [Massilia sp. TS11]MCG2583169.1 YdeI/OmpD-associated family protein [Massilia sp. TS11]